jgi:ribonucleoside-diphosphate reductase alpha chain
MFLDNSACNLASINLLRFRDESGLFDAKRFMAAARIMFIAQDILVDHASYPIKRIAENSHKYRPLGLGYSNLGTLLMVSGLPYDSEEARGLCRVVTALLHGAACRTSTELARAVGTFDAYPENRDPMLRVMEMHWDEVNKIDCCPGYLKKAARDLWDEVNLRGRRYGFRNAQATVLAPTGTISFMMDCDTTGIEPDIALVKYKQLAGGGVLQMVNNSVPVALATLGYNDEDIAVICDFIKENGTIEGAPQFLEEHLPIFDCAFASPGGTRSIPWKAHVKMMASAQPFISGAISKTVNMPANATAEHIGEAYMLGWKLGLKALAVYRDGSKGAQPLSTSSSEDEKKKKKKKAESGPRRERLPDTRESVTHKFNLSGHEGYITVGLYPDGRPGELFITMAKEGSTIGGLMDCFGTAVSMSLQYGVPLKVYCRKFSHTRFEPMGYTKNPDIPLAKSIVDYIFRWLDRTFFAEEVMGQPNDGSNSGKTESKAAGGKSSTAKEDEPSEHGPTAKKAGGRNSRQDARSKKKISNDAEDKMITRHSEASPKSTPGNNGSRVHAIVSKAAMATASKESRPSQQPSQNEMYATFQEDAPACDACGAITVRSGNCYLCYNCGRSMGCS